MKPLADRLSRAVIGCYPRRWKQRYGAEMLDVLDQHRAGPRTVLSLAGGALSTHLDPDYRMQIRLIPRLSRDAKLYIAIFAAIIVGLPALVILPMIPRAIRESRWQPSSSDSVRAIAFSRDQRIMVSATNGPHPARLAVLSVGSGALWGEAFSPDGNILASVSGRDQVTLWNVTRPDRATRMATLAGPRDYFAALAFSPRGNLLAGVTYHGSVLVFRVAGPGRPVRVTTRPGILASARFPSGGRAPASPCGCGADAAYAAAFTPDGHALTVVIGRPETWLSTAARDTVFTWRVADPGTLSDLTTIFRDVSDAQPVLAPGGRIVADGAVAGGEIRLWTLP